jgi:hypothetical protein
LVSKFIFLFLYLIRYDYLSDSEEETLLKFIEDKNATIRHEAAKFMKSRYLEEFEEEERIADESDNQTICRKFLDFVINQTNFSETPENIVDVLWDPALWESQAPKRKPREDPLGYIFLRDWKSYLGLLMPANERDNELTSAEQAVLTRTLVASIRKAMGLDICVKEKGEYNLRESSARQKRNQMLITKTFVRSIGELLQKFQADAEKIEILLDIPLHFDLTLFVEEQCKTEFLELVSIIKEIFLNRVEERIFHNCTQVLKHFLSDENPFKSDTQVIFAQLLDELRLKLEDGIRLFSDDDPDAKTNGSHIIRNALARLYTLNTRLRLETSFIPPIDEILSLDLSSSPLEENVCI